MATMVWELGDYPKLADEVIPDLGAVLVDACGVTAGQRVLDVACGAGNATIPAARRGAAVVGCDLSHALLAVGADRARSHGVDIDWRQADVQDLPFDDASFDVVLSCVGAMFAPDHAKTADELVRVCRPGGTIGMINWTPEGFLGAMLTAMRAFAPAPPSGAVSPIQWGNEEHVVGCLTDRVTDVRFERGYVHVDQFVDPAAFRDAFKYYYGPTVALYQGIADDPDKVARLDAALDAVAVAADAGSGDRLVMEWEYLLVTATRAGGQPV